MKKFILRITFIVLLILALVIVMTAVGVAQNSRSQDSAAAVKPPERTADQAFKNIKVLNLMPQSQLYPAMRFMAASLGFQCGSCHLIKNGFIDAAADDKLEKQTARQMIKMVAEINKTLAGGDSTVSCYTCHRGSRSPQNLPALPLTISGAAISQGSAASTVGLPSLDEVLNRYFRAIGGKDATERVSSCLLKGTTTTAAGQTVAYEAQSVAPDKARESFAIPSDTGRPCAGDSRCEYARVINGRQGWLKSGAGVQELVGEQLADQKLSFPLFSILKLTEQYSSLRVSGRDKIDERDVYIVSAVRLDGKSERLYFDAREGLLRRRTSYLRTLIGTIPQQMDFEDYRQVDRLRLPSTIIMTYVDPGSRPIIRKFAEIKINVQVAESNFEKPRA